MTETTPDSQMERPIESLIWAAALLVERTARLAELDEKTIKAWSESPFAKKDEEMRVAYLASLRLRAQEVADHMTERGVITDAKTVRQNPFAVCVAFETIRREAAERNARDN